MARLDRENSRTSRGLLRRTLAFVRATNKRANGARQRRQKTRRANKTRYQHPNNSHLESSNFTIPTPTPPVSPKENINHEFKNELNSNCDVSAPNYDYSPCYRPTSVLSNYTPYSSVKRKCGAFLHTPGGNNLIPEIKLSEANSPKSKLVKKDLFKSPSPSDEIYFSDDPVDDTEVKINIQSNMDFQSQILQVTPQNCQIYLRF